VVVSTFGEGRLSDAPLIGLSLTISLSFPLRGPWSSRSVPARMFGNPKHTPPQATGQRANYTGGRIETDQLQHLKKLLQNWGESADRNAT
jgi:hypothetical protein